MILKELNDYYIALPKNYILQNTIKGKVFFMELTARTIFMQNNNLKDNIVLFNEIKDKNPIFILPNKLVIKEYVLPKLIKKNCKIYFYDENNLNHYDINKLQLFTIRLDLLKDFIYIKNFQRLVKSLMKYKSVIQTLEKVYVFGYRSSGTHYLQNVIGKIIFYFSNEEAKYLQSFIYKLFRISKISKTEIDICDNDKHQKITFKKRDICPVLVYGSTHEPPNKIDMFCNNIKAIFSYRDGRDILATVKIAYTKNNLHTQKNISEEWPVYYDISTDDVKKDFVRNLLDLYGWFHNIKAYIENKDKFLIALKFEDFTIDNPNMKQNMRDITAKLVKLLNYNPNDINILFNDIDALTKNKDLILVRQGYKKIGQYKNVFEEEELTLINNYLALPLDILGYQKYDKYKDKEYIILLQKGEEHILEFAKILFEKYNTKIIQIIYIDEKYEIKLNKNYLVFSKKPIKGNIEYFSYYYPYHHYIPTMYNIGLKEEIKLNEIANKKILVVMDDKYAINNELFNILENILLNAQIIDIETFNESFITEYDYILSMSISYKIDYNFCKRIYKINPNKIISSYKINNFK